MLREVARRFSLRVSQKPIFSNKTSTSVVHEFMKKRFPQVPVLLAVLAVCYISYAMIQPAPRKLKAMKLQAVNNIAEFHSRW